jgi:hypothetical protein
MKLSRILILVLFLITILSNLNAEGFLRVSGTSIVDETNNNFYLRGIGLGGWLVQEGYMLKTSGFANAEHEIREKIQDLIGEQRTEEFYKKYWENYVREIDIKNIAEWGFNSIRLPMHYNKLTDLSNLDIYYEEGFQQIDSLLAWCEKYELYLILDLHAAPGGQSDEPISDYNPDYPSLWESEINKEITVKLWRKLAERYADKEWIGGYDLINEPKWELGDDNAPLRELYIEITNAIREVDTNHIVFIEGNWFATEFTGLTTPWDDNMVYSFHKYWNSNDIGSIQYLLTIRNQTNRPLWLGETGENSNSWFLDCIELMRDNNIGWAWWPHKKIDNISGPLSAELTPQYQQLLDYWNGQASKPSADFANAALLLQAEKLRFENCKFQPDVIDAMFRQPNDDSSIPFKEHKVPGRIFAVDYDLGKRGSAYNDKEYQNTNSDGARVWNNGWSYRNDGVDIEECSDQITNGFNVGWIESAEYLNFTVDIESSGVYDLLIRYAANNSQGQILVAVNNQAVANLTPVISTGGWQNWSSMVIKDISLTEGTHTITTKFFYGGFNINYFEFIQTSVDVEDEVETPEKFGLEQNFPNPFNPSTKIKFSIPRSDNKETSTVKLVVYDILGNEITTLVNEPKLPGNYEINFDGKNLSSGVYYYKLAAGSNTEIKKMILVK